MTRWGHLGLTGLARWLGREGPFRVEEKDGGIYVAWIDTSSDALRREAALSEKKWVEAADRRREGRHLEEQVKRAHAKRHNSALPTQPPSLGSMQGGDTTITFESIGF